MNNIVLTSFDKIREEKDLVEIEWEGHDFKHSIKRYTVLIDILKTNNFNELAAFETDFFYNKKI